LFPRNQ